MKISDMKVDVELFNATELTEEEQAFCFAVLQEISDVVVATALTRGIIPTSQLVAASVARMIKANLESGIQVANLADIRDLNRGQ